MLNTAEELTRKPLLVCLLPTFSASSDVYKTENNKPVSPLSHIFGRFAISSKILFWYNLINTDEGCTHRMLGPTTDSDLKVCNGRETYLLPPL